MRRGRAGALTADDVVRAGLELLDERGLAGFTMRSLAERLGTYPATVYWHVGNRDQLLARVVDRVLAGIAMPDATRAGWPERLTSLAREYRRIMHQHPNVAGLVASQLQVSPPALRLVEAVLGMLAGAGLEGQALAGAYNAYVGSMAHGARPARPPASWARAPACGPASSITRTCAGRWACRAPSRPSASGACSKRSSRRGAA